jgi:hypothetical protein
MGFPEREKSPSSKKLKSLCLDNCSLSYRLIFYVLFICCCWERQHNLNPIVICHGIVHNITLLLGYHLLILFFHLYPSHLSVLVIQNFFILYIFFFFSNIQIFESIGVGECVGGVCWLCRWEE